MNNSFLKKNILKGGVTSIQNLYYGSNIENKKFNFFIQSDKENNRYDAILENDIKYDKLIKLFKAIKDKKDDDVLSLANYENNDLLLFCYGFKYKKYFKKKIVVV